MTGISARFNLRVNGPYLDLSLGLPLRAYGHLAAAADRVDGRIADLVVEAVLDASRDPERIRARAVSAVSRGWDDFSVAQQLDVVTSRVATWRSGAGIAPNRPGVGKGKI